MLVTNQLEREFRFKNNGQDLVLSDPNPAMSVSDVLKFYSATYATLTTAKSEGPEVEKDKAVYKFVSTIGTKG